LTSDVFEIYKKNGKKLLPGQFWGTPIKLAENYHREMADHKKYDYIELKNSINGKKYILHKSGKYLDLNGINEYSYFSDSYPLIFGVKDQETNNNKYFFVDMKGKKLNDQSFSYIYYTAFPHIFFVKKEHNSGVQIFNIKTNKLDPEKYEEAIWMLNNYYILKKDKKYILLDKNMNEKYIFEKRIIEPTQDDYLTFYKENVLRESMIAKIYDYNKSGIFTAIKENGETVIVDFSKYFKENEENNKTTKLETRGESFKVLPKEGIKELEKTENNKTSLDTTINDDEIAINLEQMPSFPGGEKALLDFINTHLKYPPVAKENGVQGKVIIECIMEKDGTLTSCFINKNLNGGCGKEALRVVNLFPKMIPGKVKGESVRSKYTLPIDFILE